jgi:hypothetical protein
LLDGGADLGKVANRAIGHHFGSTKYRITARGWPGGVTSWNPTALKVAGEPI